VWKFDTFPRRSPKSDRLRSHYSGDRNLPHDLLDTPKVPKHFQKTLPWALFMRLPASYKIVITDVAGRQLLGSPIDQIAHKDRRSIWMAVRTGRLLIPQMLKELDQFVEFATHIADDVIWHSSPLLASRYRPAESTNEQYYP
jgi:hypothetical protein